MKIVKIIMIAAVITAAGISAYAQQGQRPVSGPTGGQYGPDMDLDGTSGSGGPPSEQKRDEVRKKMEAVRMWRLTEALKLDEKTSAKLAALLSSMDQKRGALMRESGQILRDLRLSLKAGNPDEKKIKADLTKIEKNQHEMMDLKKKELNGIKDILTIEQQARYLIFQHEFQREMRGMIAGARGQGHGGKGMRGGLGRPGGSIGEDADKEVTPPSPQGK
jgi:Spy/CpxP family protein refolding chaperone